MVTTVITIILQFNTSKSSYKSENGELRRKKKWTYLKPKTDMWDVKFRRDVTFNTIEEFKVVVVKYSIEQRYKIRFSKNQTNRAKVKYTFGGYLFKL